MRTLGDDTVDWLITTGMQIVIAYSFAVATIALSMVFLIRMLRSATSII